MKTQNNNQETGKSQVSKLTLRAGAVLLSAVMISASVDAQDLWEQLSNTVAYGKMTLTMDTPSSETKNADAAIEAIHSELASLLNATNESSAIVYAEDAMEIENWMIDEAFFSEAEQCTAEGADLEIAKYAERIIQEENDGAMEIESWMINDNFFQDAEQFTAEGADLEIAKYAEKLISQEESEDGLTVERWMTDSEFFTVAEQYTAEGADFEIAKYAGKIINTDEIEEALAIENWMTNDNFFNEAERYTADGADLEIAKYAEQLISSEEKEEGLAVENWMLDTNNFRGDLGYDHFAVR